MNNIASANIIKLRFRWPRCCVGNENFRENFYLGIWHPTDNINVAIENPPAGIEPAVVHNDGLVLISNTSNVHSQNLPLVHASPDGGVLAAFRGYLLDPAMHSYTSANDILAYWKDCAGNFASGREMHFNGVFSTAVYSRTANRLYLVNDAFGMSPLYYRKVGEMVVFATNPRFLAMDSDQPDFISWRSMLDAGYALGDRSLTSGISRVPAASVIQCSVDGIQINKWLDYENLPRGNRRVDNEAVHRVEQAFQDAMGRCLQLENGRHFLPLSSGHDSRKILATLIDRKIEFSSATVRVFQKGDLDLDARYASMMAAEYGFPHQVIEQAEPGPFKTDDYNRRLLLDNESFMHSWAMRLVNQLPSSPSIVWDGVLGDILANPGYRISTLYASPESDIRIISDASFTDAFDAILAADLWPTAANLKQEFSNLLYTLPQRINMAEFAFILFRQRRNTAVWSHQMISAGHVVVCPYMDLDYVKLLLEYNSADKHKSVFQKRTLEQFWPQFARFPGNRDIPAEAKPVGSQFDDQRLLASYEKLLDEVREANGIDYFYSLLSRKARMLFLASKMNRNLRLRRSWAYHGLLSLVSRESGKIGCWNID